MAAYARDGATEVIVGPSRRLPWPLDELARRSWDELALWSRRFRHIVPVPVAQTIAASVELAQRPELGVWRDAGSRNGRLLVVSNDPLLVGCLFRAFGAGPAMRVDSSRTGRWLDRHSDAELVALQIPSLKARELARAGWMILPRWIAMGVDLRYPERTLWDARKWETVRRIERSGLELEITRSADAAREFHERMYAPTARARHGAKAIIVRPAYVAAALRSGWLLFVRAGARRRAGMLVVPRAGCARALDALLFGAAEGDYADTELAREAAYLFAIRWARDVTHALHLGVTGAAPLLRDGILRFKKRWGARAFADLRQASCVALRVQSASPDLCRALAEQPVIALRSAAGVPSLCAPVLRASSEPRPELPQTPGIDVVDLEFQDPAALPALVERWAKAF